ncbi:MAG: LPXTG cell wall anchor domain-containing protein, partial [Lachnospiraceae bacterium]|nr:LPXTG cell wall anchor domain-containing protein [Lachnospiraceae bacterium]
GYSTNTAEYTIIITAEYYDDTVKAGKNYINKNDSADVLTEEEYNALTPDEQENYYENSWESHEQGQLKSYTIRRLLDGSDVGSTTYTYSKTGGVTETFTDTIGTTFIKNTRSPELPSTGGMGTYLFTIAGVALIAVAAFMLIFRRRRA